MPILPSIPIRCISQTEYHEIDERMMAHAIDIQNEFGRLLDEMIYKKELADRCVRDGMAARREVGMVVRHRSFSKDYFIDLLLCGSTIIEAKTAKETLSAHRGQGINYLLLADTKHGSLVNFRPPRVVRHFLSTRLTHEIRCMFGTEELNWPTDDAHANLRQAVIEFCRDIGLGLDLPLYREAIPHLIKSSRRLVHLKKGGSLLGHHEMSMLTEDVALAITALNDTEEFKNHLHRLLMLTSLSGIAWVNLRLGEIRFEHLKRVK